MLGPVEILILLVVAGLIVGIVLLVLFLKHRGTSRLSALEEEVRRLREELDRQRNRP